MFNNLNSTLKKVTIIFLIITLTYANLFLIGSNITKGLFSYATEAGEENLDLDTSQNSEEKKVTRASLALDDARWILGETNIVNYTITLDTTTENSELYIDPLFLIELPSSVESVNTKNSIFTINNDNGVFTDKKVFTTTVLGKKYVVIALTGEQTEESTQNGNTTINISLELYLSENATQGKEMTRIYYQNNTDTTYESETSFDTDEIEISLIAIETIKLYSQETTASVGIEDVDILASTKKEIVEPGEEFDYNIKIYNYNEYEKQNLILSNILPQGLSIQNVVEIVNDEETEINYNFDNQTREIKIEIDKIDEATKSETADEETGEMIEVTQAGKRTFKITVKANELEEGTYSKEIINTIRLIQDEETYIEKEVVNTISIDSLVIETETIAESINETEEIILGLKITNKGLKNAYDVKVQIPMPEEISFYSFSARLLSETGETERISEGTLSSDYEKTNLDIPAGKTYYIQIKGFVRDVEADKQISITGNVNEEEFQWTTKIVNTTTEPEIPTEPEPPVPPEGPVTPGDPTNPEEPTNPDDNAGTQEPTNPDDNAGTQEPTTPDNETEEFDLTLTQYLNKITVTNTEGTTTYEYTDTNFAKVEIHAKQMNGSKVTLEYKMIVKNEGTIPGYARKIVNYLPEGLEFNQDLNKDWYKGDDGNIYSVALIDKLLNPGETAELSIILTKQMTNEDGGTIKNIVEIYEASNDENVEDINSIPGDKLDGQNDMSTVEVIIAVKTGTIIIYITLAITVIAIIGIGFYKVKKVTLNKKGGC